MIRSLDSGRGRLAGTGCAPVMLALVLVLFGPAPAGAEGFRNITTVTVDAYFDDTWSVETANVFLARILPALTVQAKVVRYDAPGRFEHTFYLGPVISFTDKLYLITAYGLGIGDDKLFAHEGELDFNYESSEVAGSVGLRGRVMPESRDDPGSPYYYFIPSVSGRVRASDRLGLFAKLFMSWDSDDTVTSSLWGQADYRISPAVTLKGGFTVAYGQLPGYNPGEEGGWGYSLISGVDLSLRRNLLLKYSLSYLADPPALQKAREGRRGIQNALSLDVRF